MHAGAGHVGITEAKVDNSPPLKNPSDLRNLTGSNQSLEVIMEFSIGAISSGLAVLVGGVITLAYKLETRGGTINGLTCALLIIAALPFWLFVCYAIYFLVGASLKEFGQPLNPFPINILWPPALLPFAPLAAALFCWWHTALVLPYWVRPNNLTEDELNAWQDWFVTRTKKSVRSWFVVYLVLLFVVQVFHRVPCLRDLSWPEVL